jgi:SAM-dependent methyltransferase
MNAEKVREDFDEIARLADQYEGGTDRYDSFLLSLIPRAAVYMLDIGCGLGRLTAKLATDKREVLGVDLSPEMIARARQRVGATQRVSFLCGDFLAQDFGARTFDCVLSAAMLHHVPADLAVPRMVELLCPGGRLVIHDMRADAGMLDQIQSHAALAQVAFGRLLRTGWPRSPRVVREAWARHCAGETYLTLREAQALAHRWLPGARLYNHWLWCYTLVWDKPGAA